MGRGVWFSRFIDQAPDDCKANWPSMLLPGTRRWRADAQSTEWVWVWMRMSELPSSTADDSPVLYKPPPFPVPTSKRPSFRLGSVEAPTWSLLEVPPPPKFFLLTQKDFCPGAG